MKTILTILKKEFARIFKDRRLLLSLLLPGILIYSIYSLLGGAIGNIVSPSENDTYTVAFLNLPDSIGDSLNETGKIETKRISADQTEETKAQVESGKIDALFVFPEVLGDEPTDTPQQILAFYSSVDTKSAAAFSPRFGYRFATTNRENQFLHRRRRRRFGKRPHRHDVFHDHADAADHLPFRGLHVSRSRIDRGRKRTRRICHHAGYARKTQPYRARKNSRAVRRVARFRRVFVPRADPFFAESAGRFGGIVTPFRRRVPRLFLCGAVSRDRFHRALYHGDHVRLLRIRKKRKRGKFLRRADDADRNDGCGAEYIFIR